ncbi:MAG: hypothetical protein EBR82_32985 [Caulobacteraceae bacterium]|nr:hypothetical protein [Caulobacteraceae bacterium]
MCGRYKKIRIKNMSDTFQKMLYKEQQKITALSLLISNIKNCIDNNYIDNDDKAVLVDFMTKTEEQNNTNQQKINQL